MLGLNPGGGGMFGCMWGGIPDIMGGGMLGLKPGGGGMCPKGGIPGGGMRLGFGPV